MGFNCLKATEPLGGDSFLFTTKSPETPTHFVDPRKDERMSQPWNYPVVLNTGPKHRESSALTTRPLTILAVEYCCKALSYTFTGALATI